jgi:phosphoglycolate phosphatase
MNRWPACIMLDMDYTLVDSSDAIIACIAHALAVMGHRPAPPDAIRATIGLSLPAAYARLTGTIGDQRQAEQFSALFLARADETMVAGTRLLPGAADAVRALHAQGHRLAIVTSKRARIVREVLARDGLLGLFETVIGSEDVARHKPDPTPLLLCLERLSSPREAALYVGDAVADARAAQAAGVAFCWVLTGVTPREQLTAYPALALLDSVADLVAWVERTHKTPPTPHGVGGLAARS